jgi:hypothetical protein
MMREYFLPLLTNVGVIQFLKHPDVADSDVTPEYCAQHTTDRLLATVVEKRSSGCTTRSAGSSAAPVLLRLQRKRWRLARIGMRLLAREVIPKVAHLTPKSGRGGMPRLWIWKGLFNVGPAWPSQRCGGR